MPTFHVLCVYIFIYGLYIFIHLHIVKCKCKHSAKIIHWTGLFEKVSTQTHTAQLHHATQSVHSFDLDKKLWLCVKVTKSKKNKRKSKRKKQQQQQQ